MAPPSCATTRVREQAVRVARYEEVGVFTALGVRPRVGVAAGLAQDRGHHEQRARPNAQLHQRVRRRRVERALQGAPCTLTYDADHAPETDQISAAVGPQNAGSFSSGAIASAREPVTVKFTPRPCRQFGLDPIARARERRPRGPAPEVIARDRARMHPAVTNAAVTNGPRGSDRTALADDPRRGGGSRARRGSVRKPPRPTCAGAAWP